MSAIFGILRFDCVAVSTRDLERMGNTLAHRGPDGRKFVVDGCAGLGHCLMRVNQEDHFEAQPIRDRVTDLTLVADCRIDNREELAEQFGIGAVELHDMPDSALVLNAYKTWGEECAAHLIGDFAFAVWDGRAGKLVLGRDHMGQRNIFHHEGENFFAFATEIKALWALADVPRRLLDQEIAAHFHKMGGQRPQVAPSMKVSTPLPVEQSSASAGIGPSHGGVIGSRTPIRRTKTATKAITSKNTAASWPRPSPAGCGD